MDRLIVVSNRVALPNETRAGGLASAMHAALQEHGGVWFGWSGRLGSRKEEGALHHTEAEGISYVTMDMTRSEYDAYYNCFSNRTLWPLLHYRPDLIEFRRSNYEGYLRVNTLFADHLAPLIKPDDQIWVHDYHLIPLAAMLRERGIRNRIGFFLHTPLAAPSLLIVLPPHRKVIGALADYDLVGVQTQSDLHALREYFAQEFEATLKPGGYIDVDGKEFRALAFPISIDTAGVIASARESAATTPVTRLRRSLDGRALVIGVDRLDYSKGIPERFDAFGRLLANADSLRNRVSLLQIAPVSRSEVPEYRSIRRDLERRAGHINGMYGDPNWVPIRLVCKTIRPQLLNGYLRLARVALVTPFRDGMNLVAKEYVAAQDPEDPGVLILSRFAGAAEQMREALLVNPYDPDDVAEALERALSMRLRERVKRWRALMDLLEHEDIGAWRNRFLRALHGNAAPDKRGKSPAAQPIAPV
ncbi:MAG TPA: trehalose-6-phosphate synthase [Rhodanobacteraceae bacterium]|nr:trehalose-6-phosphate synthase [Rhodanobacteraceae bacterium]